MELPEIDSNRVTWHWIDQEAVIEQFIELRERMKEAGEDEVRYLRRMDYQRFLQTDYWRTVRAYRLLTANYTCEKCDRVLPDTKLEVHHKAYEHLGAEYCNLQDLLVVCRECHEKLTRTPKRFSDLFHISALKNLPPKLALLF